MVAPHGMPTLQPVNQPSSALLPHGTGGTAVPAIGGVPAVQTGGTHQPISAAMQAARSQVSFNQDVRRMHARNPSISLAQAAAQLNASLGTNWPTPAPLPSGAAVGGAVSATPAIGGGGGGGGGGTAPPVPGPPAPPGGGGAPAGGPATGHPDFRRYRKLIRKFLNQGLNMNQAEQRALQIIQGQETKVKIPKKEWDTFTIGGTTVKTEDPDPNPPLPPPKPPTVKKEEVKTEGGSIHEYVPSEEKEYVPSIPTLEPPTEETTTLHTYHPPEERRPPPPGPRPDEPRRRDDGPRRRDDPGDEKMETASMHTVPTDPSTLEGPLPSVPSYRSRTVRFSDPPTRFSDPVGPYTFGHRGGPGPFAGGFGPRPGVGGGPGAATGQGQQSGQQQAPVTVTTQGGHGASASSAGTGGGQAQQRQPIIVQAPKKKKAAPKKKAGAKKTQTGVTAARKKYTAKRKSKLAELRSAKAKRIREFNAKTKKLPAAERKKRRADFKRKVDAQYKNIVSKFPTARGMTNVQQLQRLIKQAESIRA